MDDVYYAVRDTNGAQVRSITKFTNDTPGYDERHDDPNLAQLSAGRVLLTWECHNDPHYPWDICYAVLDSAGNIIKGMANASNTSDYSFNVDAVALPNGNSVIAWHEQQGDVYRIAYAVLDGAYNRIAGPIVLNNPAAVTGDYSPSVAADATGHAILTWMDYDWSYRHNLYYALVDGNGNVLTDPMIFRTSQAVSPYIETSYTGYGNTSYNWTPTPPPGYKVYLPYIAKNYTVAPPTWGLSGLSGVAIKTLASDPNNHQIVYAGTGDSGVYKKANCDTPWEPKGLTDKGVFALAVAPNGDVYAGTYGDGMYKSTDGGKSWAPASEGLGSMYIYALAADPANSEVIYAGTDVAGIYKTTDGGGSWMAVNNGLGSLRINTLAIDPTNSQVVYAGTYDRGIYKTTDGGGSWMAVNNGLGNLRVWALAIDSTNPQVIYAATNSGVYKTTNGGASWVATGLGGKTFALAIDPQNAQRVYAGTDGSGVWRSEDGGISWRPINEGLGNFFVQALVVDPFICHVIYAGTDDGIWERPLR